MIEIYSLAFSSRWDRCSVKLCFEWHSLWNVWHIRGYLIISTWFDSAYAGFKLKPSIRNRRLTLPSAGASERNRYWRMPKAGRTFTIMMVNSCVVVIAINCDFVSKWLLHVIPFTFHVYHTHRQLEWSAIDFNAIKISLRSIVCYVSTR